MLGIDTYRLKTRLHALRKLYTLEQREIDAFMDAYRLFDGDWSNKNGKREEQIIDYYNVLNHLCSLGTVEKMYFPPQIDASTGVVGNQDAFEKKMMRDIGVRPDSRVLDIGCGRGRVANHVARETGARVTGINDGATLCDLGVGLLLHDVGKLHLPMESFAHAGPLTDDEWAQVRRHPRLGFESVENNPQVGGIARDVIMNHHEWVDGSGYPHGRRGAEISPYAQIASIANAFDRLTTDAPHREACSAPEALRIMITAGGAKYHSKLLASFIRVMAV